MSNEERCDELELLVATSFMLVLGNDDRVQLSVAAPSGLLNVSGRWERLDLLVEQLPPSPFRDSLPAALAELCAARLAGKLHDHSN